MAQPPLPPPTGRAAGPESGASRAPRRWPRWLAPVVKYLFAVPLLLLTLMVAAIFGLDTDIGHRAIADTIAGWEAKSGLRVRIGRIEGSIYGKAQLDDVTFSDQRGVFMRLPVVELDWQPLAWMVDRLAIRALTSQRGTLLRVPEFRVAEPSGPLLPGFDVRIGRLAIERLTVAKPVLGVERRADFSARVEIHARHALVAAQGRTTGGDRLGLHLDTDEPTDRFDLALDYDAPASGLLAALTGARADRRVQASGKGTWQHWRGELLAEQGAVPLAALTLGNDGGMLSARGELTTAPLAGETVARLLGKKAALAAQGRLAERVLDLRLDLKGAASAWRARGGVDFGGPGFRQLAIDGRIGDPAALGGGSRVRGMTATALLDGPLGAVAGNVRLTADELALGETRFSNLHARAGFARKGASWRAPVELTAARVRTGNATLDPRLVSGHARGVFVLDRGQLRGDDIAIDFPGLGARLALSGGAGRGGYALAGPISARGLHLADLGSADATARMHLTFGGGRPWALGLDASGRMTRIDNRTLATLAGDKIRMKATMSAAAGRPLAIARATVDASLLKLALTGRRSGAGTRLVGNGRQATYGGFSVDAQLEGAGPHATLVFADPFPAVGVKDLRLAIAPANQGFSIDAVGQSTLGPLAGALLLVLPEGGVARIDLAGFKVSDTALAGTLALRPGGADGRLTLAGGGVDGMLTLMPRDGGQGMDLALKLADARFGGEMPLSIGQGALEAHGLLARGHTTLSANLTSAGIGMGRLFLGRFRAQAKLADGVGDWSAQLSGRKGSQFQLGAMGHIEPGQFTLAASGNFAGQRITMPRRARFSAENGSWRLAPAEVDFAGGRAIASGLIAPGAHLLDIALDAMPLSIGDMVFADLGVGGSATGLLHYAKPREGPPTGEARLMIRQFTRSGLVLTSRPIDLALVGRLTPQALETRAVASEGGQVRGRLQARIANLAPSGKLGDRLRAAPLSGQLRYDGPADALWRLMAIEHFDLTGPLALAADFGGNLDNPQITGSLAGSGLRLQSALTGTDVVQGTLRGSFTGSELTLAQISGRTGANGALTGSGRIRFAELSTNRGPSFDLKLGVRNAMLLSRPDLALAASGPLRIVSDGVEGTIAGRLAIDSARWRLGQSAAAAELPNIRTREINRSADVAPASIRAMPWHFLVDATGPNRIRVVGLGIDSEWGADVRLRGTVDNPAIGGQAQLTQGTYEFAGRRFDLTRGRLTFDGSSPPDPRLDIAASASISGLTATVSVGGTSLHPDVAFSSIPAMPEEELLSRLLFGDSITQISAPEALQLGAALASLHGGGGLDPINKLRSAIGLDRLRIVNADPALNRQTGVAAGKYLGRHVYAEVITDGRGYSATNIEYRVTGWLSLLGTVSTVARQSINAKVSKDY